MNTTLNGVATLSLATLGFQFRFLGASFNLVVLYEVAFLTTISLVTLGFQFQFLGAFFTLVVLYEVAFVTTISLATLGFPFRFQGTWTNSTQVLIRRSSRNENAKDDGDGDVDRKLHGLKNICIVFERE